MIYKVFCSHCKSMFVDLVEECPACGGRRFEYTQEYKDRMVSGPPFISIQTSASTASATYFSAGSINWRT